jgi:hypothetical protein
MVPQNPTPDTPLWDDQMVEAAALHLWDEGLVRPERLGVEVVREVFTQYAPMIAANALRNAALGIRGSDMLPLKRSLTRAWLRDLAMKVESD